MPRKLTWCTALLALAWTGPIQTEAAVGWRHLFNLGPPDKPPVQFVVTSLPHLQAFLYSFPTSSASSFGSVLSLRLFTLFRSFSFLSVKPLPSPSSIRCSSFRSCSSRSRDSWELVFLFCNMFSMFFPISSKSLSSAELLSVSVDNTSVDDKTLNREKNDVTN